METLSSFSVSDLYASQEKLSNDLQNLMNLLDYCSDNNEDDVDEDTVQKEVTSILSPAEESYLESIIENKVEAIIDAAKYNNKLKNSLYKLVDAFKVFDSEFIYSTPAPSDINSYPQVSIQTQTLPRSPSLTETEIQTAINDSISEVIVLDQHNNEHKTPVRIIDTNEGSLEENPSNESFVDYLHHLRRISMSFKKLVKNQENSENENNENEDSIMEELVEFDQDSEETIITDKDQDFPIHHSTSDLSEAIENSQMEVTKDVEVEVNLDHDHEKENDILLNQDINNDINIDTINNSDINTNTTNNNDDNQEINHSNDSSHTDSNNDDITNDTIFNNNNQNIITSAVTTATNTTTNEVDNLVEVSNTKEHSTVIKPINVKNRKNYKRKNKNQTKESFTNSVLLSSPDSSLDPAPSTTPSQSIQQTVLAARIQSILSKQRTKVTTREVECQTDSYKVVIRGEDFNIPPGYFGHYAVVPLWAIWIIGYYYKKKTKPKSMWKLLALKTPGLLAKSRAQNRAIKRVERINS